MLLLTYMPESSSSARPGRRIIDFSEAIAGELERRRSETGIPVTIQIRQAVERYLKTPHEVTHRLLVTKKEARKPASIPDTIWSQMKERKKKTGLDLVEQVQVAVALYLQSAEEVSTRLEADDLKLTAPEEKASKNRAPLSSEDIQRMISLEVEKKAENLYERLRAEGKPVRPAVPALMQVTKYIPKTRTVCCGGGDDLDNIVIPLENGGKIPVTGKLAELATERSFIAEANGWSMSDGETKFDIRPGDDLLLTPIDEYKGTIKKGSIVLARITYKDGRIIETLKAYEGRKLRANNPNFPPIKLGPSVERAEIVAVCRGVTEKIFG